ncbi:CBS domain-containing protein [Kibdelosporangium philippinense]|nr:CBS domain-containing protein [Kibdelosporangium philippinense]
MRAIPIVDEGRLVGIVTRRDLLRTIAREDEAIV